MRIAYDATSIPRLMAGAGVYTDNLLRALARVDGDNEYVVFARTDAFDALQRERPPFRVVHVGARSRATRLVWEQLVLPAQLRAQAIDVVHSPHHTSPLLNVGGRRVVTFHDLTFFILPERYPRRRRYYFRAVSWASAKAASMLICPSLAVRDDIVRILHAPPGQGATDSRSGGARLPRLRRPGARGAVCDASTCFRSASSSASAAWSRARTARRC